MRKQGTDTDEVMQEMRESGQKIIESMTNIAKNIDWKSMIPKVVFGLVVIYGLRRHKLILSLVVPMVLGMIGKEVTGEMREAEA